MFLQPLYRVLVEYVQIACAVILYKHVYYLHLTLILCHPNSLAKPINYVLYG